MQWEQGVTESAPFDDPTWPILVCLLGNFRLLKSGQPVSVRSGGKTEALLCNLALQPGDGVSREMLLERIWSDSEAPLAGQALNSLIYSLHKQLGDAIGGAAPIVRVDSRYRLNAEAGVGVDVADFQALVDAGDRCYRGGTREDATVCYVRALRVYHGDLFTDADVQTALERERLRAVYLTLLARLADQHFAQGDYAACLERCLRLLAGDPCREDAHRMAMRCYVRSGQRAQALRQYQLCKVVLRNEFDAAPEPATTALFDRLRLDPAGI